MPAVTLHRESYIVRISLERANPGDDAPWHVRGEIEDAATRETWRFGSLEGLAQALASHIQARIDRHSSAGAPGSGEGDG